MFKFPLVPFFHVITLLYVVAQLILLAQDVESRLTVYVEDDGNEVLTNTTESSGPGIQPPGLKDALGSLPVPARGMLLLPEIAE